MNITQKMADTYRAVRKTGSSTDATKALMANCGLGFDEACDAAWLIETGKAEPKWQHEDGSPTAACHDFYAALDHEED